MRGGRWVGPVVALALVVGLVAGCSGSGSPTTNSSGGGGSSGGGFAWAPFGPDDPQIPTPGWPAYNPFADGNCSKLRKNLDSLGAFGKAMVAVCAAAIEGRQDQWEMAEKAFAAGDASSLADDCLAKKVTGLLERALAWHQRHPGRKPLVQFQRVTGNKGERKTDCGKKETTTTTETTTTETTTTETTG